MGGFAAFAILNPYTPVDSLPPPQPSGVDRSDERGPAPIDLTTEQPTAIETTAVSPTVAETIRETAQGLRDAGVSTRVPSSESIAPGIS